MLSESISDVQTNGNSEGLGASLPNATVSGAALVLVISRGQSIYTIVIGEHWDMQASPSRVVANTHRHHWRKESGARPGLCSAYRSNENLDQMSSRAPSGF